MAIDRGLRILQWNSRGVRNKKNELQSISNDFDILMLCGTFLKKDIFFKMDNFNVIRVDRTCNRGGGLGMALRKGIVCSDINTILSIENSLETQAITIKSSIGELLIVSIYSRVPAAASIIGSATWPRLLSSISDINAQAVFVGGDFNYHHISWSSPRICLNGDEFCQAVDNTNLICLNNGSPTYINRPDNLSSVLDLSSVPGNLFSLASWNIWEDSMGSNHLPVLVYLGVTIPIATFTSHRYDSFVTENVSVLVSQTDSPTNRYNLFLKGVDAAVLASAPQPEHRSHSSTDNSGL